MTWTTHTCPGGCGRQVPNHLFACAYDWHRLPPSYQTAISRAYQRDDAAHLQAMVTARRWYQGNPRTGAS
jgi:hypothetical protein